jgi:uncharacterized protein
VTIGRTFSIILVMLASAPFQASAQGSSGPPFIAVQGSAEIDVVPDIFPVSIDISEVGLDLGASQQLVERLTHETLAAARSGGLPDADIFVGDLSIEPEKEYDSELKKQVFKGNRYARSLTFRFHALAELKAFLAAAPSGKNVEVTVQDFETSNNSELRRKLLVDAIDDARRTADVMAKGIGRRATAAQTISTSPMTLSVGSYAGSFDGQDTRRVVTAEQISRLPLARSAEAVALLAPGAVRSEIVLERGTIRLHSDVYIIYLLAD